MTILENIKKFVKGDSEPIEPEEEINVDLEKRKDVSLSDNNEVLLAKMKFRRDESEKLLKDKRNQWEQNIKFFNGKQWQVAGISIPTYRANIVVNKWFAAVRSLVALETDSKPDPQVEANVDMEREDSEIIIKASQKVEASLDYNWDMRQIPNILTQIYYDRYNMDDGFGMYFWNNDIDNIDFEQIKPYEILPSPEALSIEDAEYVIIKKQRNRKWFKTYYPEDVDKIKFEVPKREIDDNDIYSDINAKRDGYANTSTVYHYFEDDVWITFTDNLILEKTKNLYWEWRSPLEQREELKKEVGEVPQNWKPITNHLVKPEKPVVHFKGYYTGGAFFSTSLIMQAMILNIAVNKRKCQIQDNADGVGNGQWIVDPSIPRDMVNLITSRPGLKIRVNPSLIRKEPGTPLPEFIFTDLSHSEQKFDDMVGHHEISRGGSSSKRQTAREAMLLRETDVTPVRLLLRNSEVAIAKILNGWVQLQKLFYDEKHFIGQSNTGLREGAGKFLIRDEIPNKLSIIVKVGSTLPTSREVKRSEYVRDFAAGVIDPLTYLQQMNYPNPKKILNRVLNWQQGIISDDEPQQGMQPGQAQAQTGSKETLPGEPPQSTGGL